MKLSFRIKSLAAILVACAVCSASAIYVASQRISQEGEQALIEKSRAILSRLEVVRNYVGKAGKANLERVTQETLMTYPDGQFPEEHKLRILHTVPIFASMKVGSTDADKENYQFRIFAGNPRNERHTPTESERRILEGFLAGTLGTEVVVRSADASTVSVVRPIYLTEQDGCLSCHGHPSRSPWGNGRDLLGYPMEDWKDGDMHGAFAVVSSLEPVRAAAHRATRQIVAWSAGFTVLALLIGYLILRGPVKRLDTISIALKDEGDQLGEVSRRMSGASEELSSGVNESAASLEQTVAAIQEISSMTEQTAGYSSQCFDRAKSVAARTEDGGRTMQRMVNSMESIHEANTQLHDMAGIIHDISTKTAIINDIVFKTQLLSFNASIEAARAGQHGRGFAVVAEEVGNLAETSGNAAKEIQALLEESEKRVHAIVESTQARVTEGSEVSKEALEIFHGIAREVQEIAAQLQSISDATREQSAGIHEISSAMSQMDELTHRNSTVAVESAKIATRLSEASTRVRLIVEEMRGVVLGESSDPARERKEPSLIHLESVVEEAAARDEEVTDLVQRIAARAQADDRKQAAPEGPRQNRRDGQGDDTFRPIGS